MRLELRERSFGELVGLCFSLSATHFVPLFLIAGLCSLPMLLLQLVSTSTATAAPELPAVFLMLFLIPLNVILQMIAQGASILIVASTFTGDSPTIGASISAALQRLGSLFVLSLIYGLLIGFGFLLCRPFRSFLREPDFSFDRIDPKYLHQHLVRDLDLSVWVFDLMIG